MTTTPSDRQTQEWMNDWTAPDAAAEPATALRRHVLQRNRIFAVWMGGEAAVGGGAFVVLATLIARTSDPFEQVALSLLATIALAALAFAAWNWRGSWRPPTETTAAFLAASEARCRMLRRGASVGWLILAAEGLVFVPWVWHRAGGPSSSGPAWPWALLVGLLALGVLFVIGVGRWADREVRLVATLRREIDADSPD